MYKIGKYLPSDSMSDLICDNYPMLLVTSRFGINLGFGKESISEVCKKYNIDTNTFLAVVNILNSNDKTSIKIDYTKISLSALIQYLHRSHSYFLKYRLPLIRQKLIESLVKNDDVSVVIKNYYDEYVKEVENHMGYEENILFPYINSMITGSDTDEYNIEKYRKHHDKVEAKLSELKNIIIRYYPAQTTNELNSVLYDIFSCEEDLASHNAIENFLLVPAIKKLETLKSR